MIPGVRVDGASEFPDCTKTRESIVRRKCARSASLVARLEFPFHWLSGNLPLNEFRRQRKPFAMAGIGAGLEAFLPRRFL
jgi:hypothetical protein